MCIRDSREIGREYDIPVMSSPPLTRALYHATEIGQEIPEGLFAAVAQVLAYVYQLKKFRRGRDVYKRQDPNRAGTDRSGTNRGDSPWPDTERIGTSRPGTNRSGTDRDDSPWPAAERPGTGRRDTKRPCQRRPGSDRIGKG